MVAVLPVQQRLQVHWLTCGVIAIALTYHFSRGDIRFIFVTSVLHMLQPDCRYTYLWGNCHCFNLPFFSW